MPSVQRRVSPNGKVSYRALVRLKGHKPKTATFIKKADAVTWAQELVQMGENWGGVKCKNEHFLFRIL